MKLICNVCKSHNIHTDSNGVPYCCICKSYDISTESDCVHEFEFIFDKSRGRTVTRCVKCGLVVS